MLAAGHEVGHGSYSRRSPVDLTADEERAKRAALAALHQAGAEPRGHRAAMWKTSWLTPKLVAEHGMRYDSSLMDTDVPSCSSTGAGEIAELPPHWSLDDGSSTPSCPVPTSAPTSRSPLIMADAWIHELDAMRRHGALFMLTCHPFLSGRAGRIEGLRRVIEAGLERGDVQFCTCLEVADRVREADDAEERQRSRRCRSTRSSFRRCRRAYRA